MRLITIGEHEKGNFMYNTIMGEIKITGMDQQNADMEAWGIAVTIYPDLSKLIDRISSLSEEAANDCISYLLSTKKFKDGDAYLSDFEARLLDDLCEKNKDLIEYTRLLLDEEYLYVVRFLVSHLKVLGGDVDLQLIKSRIKSFYPETAVFSFTPQTKGMAVISKYVTRISAAPRASNGAAHIAFLKNSKSGRLFIRLARPFPVVKKLSNSIWRIWYPHYVNYIESFFMGAKRGQWSPLVCLADFVKKNKISTHKLANAVSIETPEPKVFPSSDQDYLVPPHDRYEFPEIYVATISDAEVSGGTNFVLVGDEVVCHDLYDFDRDYTSEELHGRTVIAPRVRRARCLTHDEAPVRVAVAATFVDACAPNYAHWMTEVLPRIALFCAEERYKSVPLVVNDGLHDNIMASLALVAGVNREIIALPIGRALCVKELYLTSVTGYVPFDRRTKKITNHSHGMFSSQAFEILRNHLNALRDQIEEGAWPEKVYIRRNSGGRKVTNAADLEELITARGFVVVEPEKLTFLQQVQLFSNAKVVVGSTGAAFANLMFCRRDVEIFILISKHPDTSYWYWQNMACASGKKVNYVLGDSGGSSSSGIHADFTVNLGVLARSIEGGIRNA